MLESVWLKTEGGALRGLYSGGGAGAGSKKVDVEGGVIAGNSRQHHIEKHKQKHLLDRNKEKYSKKKHTHTMQHNVQVVNF